MTSTSKAEINEKKQSFYDTLTHFPPVINGKINMVQFLEASTGLITLVERYGILFAPVKHDMQGNVDKIRKYYNFDKNSCLLECMSTEVTNRQNGAESVLWLNRALKFFELVFQEIISRVKLNNDDMQIQNIFNVAYEGSIKKYHNWVTQQLFIFVCKTCPTLPQLLKTMDVDNGKEFEPKLTNYHHKLQSVRCKIDEYFEANNLFGDSKRQSDDFLKET